jgi:hypothetical protein
MSSNDPWRIFRARLQKFADAREDLVWASSQGVHSEAYSDASAIYSRRRAQVIEAVEQLIQMGKRGEL